MPMRILFNIPDCSRRLTDNTVARNILQSIHAKRDTIDVFTLHRGELFHILEQWANGVDFPTGHYDLAVDFHPSLRGAATASYRVLFHCDPSPDYDRVDLGAYDAHATFSTYIASKVRAYGFECRILPYLVDPDEFYNTGSADYTVVKALDTIGIDGLEDSVKRTGGFYTYKGEDTPFYDVPHAIREANVTIANGPTALESIQMGRKTVLFSDGHAHPVLTEDIDTVIAQGGYMWTKTGVSAEDAINTAFSAPNYPSVQVSSLSDQGRAYTDFFRSCTAEYPEELRRIRSDLGPVVSFLNNSGVGFIIVGGAIRDVVAGETPKDIDIHLMDITRLADIQQFLLDHGYVKSYGTPFTEHYQLLGNTIDLFTARSSTAGTYLNSVDFTINAVVIDNQFRLYYDSRFFDHVKRRTFDLVNAKGYGQTAMRTGKMKERGFKPSVACEHTICNDHVYAEFKQDLCVKKADLK